MPTLPALVNAPVRNPVSPGWLSAQHQAIDQLSDHKLQLVEALQRQMVEYRLRHHGVTGLAPSNEQHAQCYGLAGHQPPPLLGKELHYADPYSRAAASS